MPVVAMGSLHEVEVEVGLKIGEGVDVDGSRKDEKEKAASAWASEESCKAAVESEE